MRDLRKTAEAARVAENYDIEASQLYELKKLFIVDPYEALVTAFKYGYVMGSRATLAELKRKRMNNM